MTAVSSFGTLLKVGDGATPTEAFTTIGGVKDISGPSLSMETEEVTNHGSAASEFVATVLGGGEVSFEVNFDYGNAQHASLMTDMMAGTLRNFQLVLTDAGATTIDFAAIVTGYELNAPVKGILSASLTLTVSGEVTFTA